MKSEDLFKVQWWGSLGISAMIALVFGGAHNGTPIVILLLWPFVGLAFACVTSYWKTKEEKEERRIRNSRPEPEAHAADRSLPQLSLQEIKDRPPLSREELMDLVQKFHK